MPVQQPNQQYGDDEDDDDMAIDQAAPRELKIVEQLGTFDAITTWKHENVPLDSEDPYIKGIQEWITFANAVRLDRPD